MDLVARYPIGVVRRQAADDADAKIALIFKCFRFWTLAGGGFPRPGAPFYSISNSSRFPIAINNKRIYEVASDRPRSPLPRQARIAWAYATFSILLRLSASGSNSGASNATRSGWDSLIF